MPFSAASQKNVFYRRTRNGVVIKTVDETYTQRDCSFGFLHGKQLNKQSFCDIVHKLVDGRLLVVDTNVALHQIDILESESQLLSALVFPQTTLQELRNLNVSVFKRVMTLLKDERRLSIFLPNQCDVASSCVRQRGESSNDFHDRCIVNSCLSLEKFAKESAVDVVLLTNDVGNQSRAKESGVNACSMQAFVRSYAQDYPELQDKISIGTTTVPVAPLQYPAYIQKDELSEGIRRGTYFQGTLRVKSSSWASCYVIVKINGIRKGINIDGPLHVNRALEGDFVAVEVLPFGESIKKIDITRDTTLDQIGDSDYAQVEGIADSLEESERQLEGRVVSVLRRNVKHYFGSVDSNTSVPDQSGGVLLQFVPVEKKLPRMWIRAQNADNLIGLRIMVSVDHWPTLSDFPLGHLVKILGAIGDKDIETEILLHELGIDKREFSTAVMSCLPAGDWKITEDALRNRRDFRSIPVASVDPPGCKDIDDALHCLRLPNGNWQVGVHIADVTHFVKPGTALDKEAAERSTSTYLVERRLDMLPGLLTTQLCSLRCNEDHLAFSVLWEMDDEANILSVDFCKSVIDSKASLTYDQAQTIIDSKGDKSNALSTSIQNLNRLAKILKQRRVDAGALTLASPEVRFKLDDETHNPTDLAIYNIKESNSMVEEWMLLANITVSKKILKHYPTLSVLRRHQPPSRDQFLPLLLSARTAGFELDITNSKALADSLDEAVRPDDPMFNKLLRMLATRCMMPAQYFCSGEIPKDQWHHYGLATQVYTHFTSPIRRYADVLVHRLLAASLGIENLPSNYADRIKQQEQCTHMNRKHRAAQHAQRASVGIYSLIYFRNSATVESAYVIAVELDCVKVVVPKYGIEGPIFFSDLELLFSADQSIVDIDSFSVTFRCPYEEKKIVRILQKMNVAIVVEENSFGLGKVVLKCI